MSKPIIGITSNTILAESTIIPGMTRVFVSADYINAVTAAGGIPFLLPPVAHLSDAREQIQAIDGLILSGGSDVDPFLYGEEPSEKLGAINLNRDEYELMLIKLASELNKPMLGICRGIQIINVAHGGTLYQDISHIKGSSIKHFQNVTERHALWHTVDIDPASSLATILNKESLRVNSYHHQSLKRVAPGFIVTARAKDGIIEAIEYQGNLFILGIQWHPEMLAKKSPTMLSLFEALVKEATSGKRITNKFSKASASPLSL